MPRRPTGSRSRSLIARPRTFSPFGRTLVHVNRRQSLYTGPRKTITKHDSVNDGIESSDDEQLSQGDIQVDFSFFDPKPDDFHGVKMLLQAYLDDKVWDLSGFVDIILEQTTVGTVIKLEDDEDNNIFSVITVLNLGRYKDHRCIKEIKEFLHKVGQEKTIKDDLRLLLEEQSYNVGLLVSQRVTNFPYQLLPPLYDGLFDEVSWATEDEPTEELRKAFCFKTYLLVTKVYELKNKNHKKGHAIQTDEAIIYVKPEDELFHKLATWSFRFPLHVASVSTQELQNHQLTALVMAIDAGKVPAFRKQLRALVTEL